MSNHATTTARSYGNGFVAGRGGFLPYGSTTASTTQPVIPSVSRDPSLELPQPRWGGFNIVVHDPNFTGVYDIQLDDDWADLIVDPIAHNNLQYSVPSLVLLGATAGHGLTIAGVQAGAGSQATIPIKSVTTVYSGSSAPAATISAGAITLTIKTGGDTLANVAAAINAATATVGVTSSAGDSTSTGTTATTLYFSGGVSGLDEYQASVFLPSDTSGDGITLQAVKPGAAGNAIRVVYVYSGTAAPAVAVSGNLITVTIATATGSTTNASIAAAIAASAPASALVSVVGVTVPSDTNTSKNTSPGVALTGGGLVWAKLTGPVLATAVDQSYQSGDTYYHFRVGIYEGDTLVDLSAQTELLMASTTAGSGVLFQSQQAPAQASVSVLSTSGAGNGITYTAKQAGDVGNFSGVVYNNPLATIFIPSTTPPDGVLWTSQIAGLAGRGIQIVQTAPTGNSSIVISVSGFTVTIQPTLTSTNANLVSAVAANVSAAALISGVSTVGSDLASPNSFVGNLGGGYSQGAGTATVAQEANLQGGYTLFVNFGTGATNTTVKNAVTALAGVQFTAAVISSSGSDAVVATAFAPLTGGSDPADLTVTYTYSGSASPPTAAFSGNSLVVTIQTAGDTNANVAAAVNEAVNGAAPQLLATVFGVGTDNNLPPVQIAVAGSVSWGPRPLACHNQVELEMFLRNSVQGAV